MSEFRRKFRSELFSSVGVVLALGVAALVLLGYIFYRSLDTLQSYLGPPRFPDPAKPRVLGQADAEWRVRGLDGATYRFSDFNDRVVFVNVWATWCAPCIEEMPTIGRLYEALGEERVAFLIVSEEDQETVRQFVERRKYPFPVYVKDTKLPRVFDSAGIPATFIVDRSGRVVFRHFGAADWSSVEAQNFLLALAGQQE
jgi:thiol-disulfide isomerase/thioredoxin